jgi:hypothetical protein
MTAMNSDNRSERKPVFNVVGCWDEDSDTMAGSEQFDQKPPHLLDFEVESFWAGRNKAARISTRIAA